MLIRRKKNLLVPSILIILLWFTLVLLVYFVEPETIKDLLIPGAYLPFFANLSLALFLTLSLILANSKRAIIFTSGILIFLILRLWGLGNWLNLILLLGIILTLDRYSVKH